MSKQRFRVFHTYNDLSLHKKMQMSLSDMYHFAEITNQKFKLDTSKSLMLKHCESLVVYQRRQTREMFTNVRINHVPVAQFLEWNDNLLPR